MEVCSSTQMGAPGAAFGNGTQNRPKQTTISPGKRARALGTTDGGIPVAIADFPFLIRGLVRVSDNTGPGIVLGSFGPH